MGFADHTRYDDPARMHRHVAAVLVVAASACAPTFAPPLRSGTMGAPGRVQAGDVDLGGAAVGTVASAPRYGGPALAIGITDGVAIEAGGDFAASGWAMGFGGARLTGRVPLRKQFRLVGDTEFGAGAGVGGSRCRGAWSCVGDGRRWYERAAGGGYLGVGGALRWRIPTIYTRLRVQATTATSIPSTIWTTWNSGVELRFARRVSLWAAVGLADYWNRRDSRWGFIYELGLAVRLSRRGSLR